MSVSRSNNLKGGINPELWIYFQNFMIVQFQRDN